MVKSLGATMMSKPKFYYIVYDIYIYIYRYICKDLKVCSPSPLRVMGCAFQTWPKSIKFVKGGKEQQQWVLLEDNYKEELGLYSKANEY